MSTCAYRYFDPKGGISTSKNKFTTFLAELETIALCQYTFDIPQLNGYIHEACQFISIVKEKVHQIILDYQPRFVVEEKRRSVTSHGGYSERRCTQYMAGVDYKAAFANAICEPAGPFPLIQVTGKNITGTIMPNSKPKKLFPYKSHSIIDTMDLEGLLRFALALSHTMEPDLRAEIMTILHTRFNFLVASPRSMIFKTVASVVQYSSLQGYMSHTRGFIRWIDHENSQIPIEIRSQVAEWAKTFLEHDLGSLWFFKKLHEIQNNHPCFQYLLYGDALNDYNTDRLTKRKYRGHTVGPTLASTTLTNSKGGLQWMARLWNPDHPGWQGAKCHSQFNTKWLAAAPTRGSSYLTFDIWLLFFRYMDSKKLSEKNTTLLRLTKIQTLVVSRQQDPHKLLWREIEDISFQNKKCTRFHWRSRKHAQKTPGPKWRHPS